MALELVREFFLIGVMYGWFVFRNRRDIAIKQFRN